MERLFVALVLALSLSSPAHALTFDYEHQSGTRYSYPYGWAFNYDIGLVDDVLKVDVDIRLTGATVADALRTRWETGIESIWSTNRFAVPILFNVDWVTSAWDYSVQVVDSTGRWNMLNWYTISGSGWGDAYQEEVAAHEYGHMLSLWDEYSGGAVDPVTHLIGTGGLMETLGGPTLDYYYDPFLDWYAGKLASYNGGEDPAPVPEPSTFLLVGAGLLAAVAVRRRQTA